MVYSSLRPDAVCTFTPRLFRPRRPFHRKLFEALNLGLRQREDRQPMPEMNMIFQ
jgi:hypothetical protein